MESGPTLEQLGDTVQRLAEMVGDPKHGDETFDTYLRFTARLHSYSTRNTLLIMWQCPEASYLASYRTWEALGRQVKRGEAGIAIIRPGKRYLRGQNGRRCVLVGKVDWRVAHVFDAAQTIGEAPIPNYKPNLQGDTEPLLLAASAFAAWHDIAVDQEPMRGSLNGKSLGGRIILNSSRCDGVRLGTMLHEIAHELLHPLEQRANLSLQQSETEAESVATVVLNAFGFETLPSSASYIRQHTHDADQVLASLDRIRLTAHLMIGGLQRHLPSPAAKVFDSCATTAATASECISVEP